MQFTDQPNVSVALVYQSQALRQHLRSALDEFGAKIVYESATSAFDHGALEQSGASVVLINLDPAIDEEIEHIEQLLADDTRRVIFNDGEVTSKLSGWDLARWARHLAAKIIGDTQLLPARPAGAEAVPVRQMPQHGLDSTFKPNTLRAPVVSSEAEALASREITDALGSLRDAEPLGSVSPAKAQEELQATLNDFGFFSDTAAPVPFNDLAARIEKPVVSIEAVADPGFDAAAPVATDSPEDLNALFADFSFDENVSLSIEPDAAGVDAGTNVPAVSGIDDDDASAFADIQFDFDEASAARAESAVAGLDDFLAQHTYKPQEVTVELPAPAMVSSKRAAIDVDQLLSNLSLELSPIDDEAPGPASVVTETAAPASAAPAASLASEFDDILSALSLEPMQAEQPVAPPAAAAVTPTPGARVFDGLGLSLEPIAAETEVDGGTGFEANPFADLDFGDDAASPAAVAAQPASRGSDAAPSAGALSRVWVLGASIGGPDAVREFLSGIPDNTGNLFLLAQHMGADFIDLMISQLGKATALDVRMAVSGGVAQHGQVLVVPLAERLLLDADGQTRVVPLDEASPYSPSIDQVLFDVADRFGSRAGAIIFSGMAHDAIEGAKYLAAKGGIVWAQDPATCVVSSMIDGAVEAGIVRFQGSPAVLAQKFISEFR